MKRHKTSAAEDFLYDDSFWFRFPRAFIKVMGPYDSILLAYLMRERQFRDIDKDGWFAFSVKEMQIRLNFTPKQQLTSLKKMGRVGLLQTKVVTKSGKAGSIRYIRLFVDKIISFFSPELEEMRDGEKGYMPKREANISPKGKLIASQKGSSIRVPATDRDIYNRKRQGKPARDELSFGIVPKLTFSEKIVDEFYKILSSHNFKPFKFATKSQKKYEANLIRKLKSQVGKDRIRQALAWYSNAFGKKFTPEATTAGGFVQKFHKIESAIRRDNHDKPSYVVDRQTWNGKDKKLMKKYRRLVEIPDDAMTPERLREMIRSGCCPW